MRWRTEKEVIDGKGQFTCGEVHCSNTNMKDLCSFEVPFKYSTKDGQKKTTLVKVRLCGPCALKLYYRKIREYEGKDSAKRQRRKECNSSSEIFDYIHEVLKEDEIEIEQPPPMEPVVSNTPLPVGRIQTDHSTNRRTSQREETSSENTEVGEWSSSLFIEFRI